MWHEGTIGIPKDGNNRMAHYWVKNNKRKCVHGINGGKITKLLIKIGNEIVADYDCGCWIKKPDEEDQMVMVAYYICLKEYN